MTYQICCKKVDITRASARRLLLTLESLGYVTQNDNYFSLTPKVIDLEVIVILLHFHGQI